MDQLILIAGLVMSAVVGVVAVRMGSESSAWSNPSRASKYVKKRSKKVRKKVQEAKRLIKQLPSDLPLTFNFGLLDEVDELLEEVEEEEDLNKIDDELSKIQEGIVKSTPSPVNPQIIKPPVTPLTNPATPQPRVDPVAEQKRKADELKKLRAKKLEDLNDLIDKSLLSIGEQDKLREIIKNLYEASEDLIEIKTKLEDKINDFIKERSSSLSKLKTLIEQVVDKSKKNPLIKDYNSMINDLSKVSIKDLLTKIKEVEKIISEQKVKGSVIKPFSSLKNNTEAQKYYDYLIKNSTVITLDNYKAFHNIVFEYDKTKNVINPQKKAKLLLKIIGFIYDNKQLFDQRFPNNDDFDSFTKLLKIRVGQLSPSAYNGLLMVAKNHGWESLVPVSDVEIKNPTPLMNKSINELIIDDYESLVKDFNIRASSLSAFDQGVALTKLISIIQQDENAFVKKFPKRTNDLYTHTVRLARIKENLSGDKIQKLTKLMNEAGINLGESPTPTPKPTPTPPVEISEDQAIQKAIQEVADSMGDKGKTLKVSGINKWVDLINELSHLIDRIDYEAARDAWKRWLDKIPVTYNPGAYKELMNAINDVSEQLKKQEKSFFDSLPKETQDYIQGAWPFIRLGLNVELKKDDFIEGEIGYDFENNKISLPKNYSSPNLKKNGKTNYRYYEDALISILKTYLVYNTLIKTSKIDHKITPLIASTGSWFNIFKDIMKNKDAKMNPKNIIGYGLKEVNVINLFKKVQVITNTNDLDNEIKSIFKELDFKIELIKIEDDIFNEGKTENGELLVHGDSYANLKNAINKKRISIILNKLHGFKFLYDFYQPIMGDITSLNFFFPVILKFNGKLKGNIDTIAKAGIGDATVIMPNEFKFMNAEGAWGLLLKHELGHGLGSISDSKKQGKCVFGNDCAMKQLYYVNDKDEWTHLAKKGFCDECSKLVKDSLNLAKNLYFIKNEKLIK